MDYLQYNLQTFDRIKIEVCFKPCYKWITFNTDSVIYFDAGTGSFKPCYKWITFNTQKHSLIFGYKGQVLNLVINGLPSIRKIR